jgi:multiple antibiotic resistance protein
MNGTELASAIGLLLLTTDPLGNVPCFVSVLNRVPPEQRRAVVVRELLIALGIMLTFLFAGRPLMGWMGIRAEAIAMAGAIVLFLIAIEMILPGSGRRPVSEEDHDPFIVPLATPLVAGPAVLATLILISSKPGGLVLGLLAVLVSWLVTFGILLSAPPLMRLLRQRGARAVERLMGMLLVMLAVQMFLNGLNEYRAGEATKDRPAALGQGSAPPGMGP